MIDALKYATKVVACRMPFGKSLRPTFRSSSCGQELPCLDERTYEQCQAEEIEHDTVVEWNGARSTVLRLSATARNSEAHP